MILNKYFACIKKFLFYIFGITLKVNAFLIEFNYVLCFVKINRYGLFK